MSDTTQINQIEGKIRTTLKLVNGSAQSTPMRRETGNLEDPINRCIAHGANALSLRECVSLILRNHTSGSKGIRAASAILRLLAPGMAEEDQLRALFTTLESASSSPTPKIQSLTRIEEARMLASFELARRYHFYVEASKTATSSRMDLSRTTKAALGKIGSEWRNHAVEWLGFVPVFKRCLGSLCIVERGVRTHVNVDPAELFARILALRPRAVVLFHNHPSGDLTPSRHDHNLTRQVDLLCGKLGIELVAHWIVSGAREVKIDMESY